MPAGTSPFATFLIVGPTCFFLGILFASFPYDYYVLWSTPPASPPAWALGPPGAAAIAEATSNVTDLRAPYLALLEHHLQILHGSPPLISRILHIIIGTGLLGLVAKLYKPTEANMLFDGASLVLYMCAVTVYITNLVKGMRVVTAGAYGQAGADLRASRFIDENQRMAEAAKQPGNPRDVLTMGREDSLKVLAASNTILALVLAGVLILQAGQWYAQKKESAEIAAIEAAERKKRDGGSSSSAAEEKAAAAPATAAATGVDAAAPAAGTGTGASTAGSGASPRKRH